MTDILSKAALSQISRAEFLSFVRDICSANAPTEEEGQNWVRHFKALVPHPSKTDLIFWPAEGADDSPEGIVDEIERYCRENGLPGFKDSDF